MKLSLLELTQNILSALDGDEVNSISDSAESRQVAQVIRTAYFNIIARANLPEQRKLFQLTASGDTDLPVLMTKPDNVAKIDWIKYNVSNDPENDGDNFNYVTILPLEQFLYYTENLDTTESNVETMSLNSQTFAFRNDVHPTYCTVLDDYNIVFDAFYETLDTTLQESKTKAFGLTIPTFSISDSFIPDLDEQQFPLLLNEAKSLAFLEMKQIAHEQAAQESKRQWRSLQKNKSLHETNPFDLLPDFGRK